MKQLLIISFIFIYNLFGQTDSLTVISKDIYKCTDDTSVSVKISYPQLINLQNKDVQNKINLLLENYFSQALQNYQEFTSDSEYIADYPADMAFYFETSFRTTYLTNDFFSVVMDYNEFTGGAHGNYFSQGYNFRLSDGELFYLSDIIKESQLENLSLFCEQEILKQFEANSLSDVLFEDEINIKEDQDFFIKPGYLVIQFDPYEIGPYSMGSIEVEISFDRIKNLLKPNIKF